MSINAIAEETVEVRLADDAGYSVPVNHRLGSGDGRKLRLDGGRAGSDSTAHGANALVVDFGASPMSHSVLDDVYEQMKPLRRKLLSGLALKQDEKARLDYLQWHVNRARLAEVKLAAAAAVAPMRARMHLRDEVHSLVESLRAVPGAFGRRKK